MSCNFCSTFGSYFVDRAKTGVRRRPGVFYSGKVTALSNVSCCVRERLVVSGALLSFRWIVKKGA